jgi:hypothetical protein
MEPRGVESVQRYGEESVVAEGVSWEDGLGIAAMEITGVRVCRLRDIAGDFLARR